MSEADLLQPDCVVRERWKVVSIEHIQRQPQNVEAKKKTSLFTTFTKSRKYGIQSPNQKIIQNNSVKIFLKNDPKYRLTSILRT